MTFAERGITLAERVESLEDQLDGVMDVLEFLTVVVGYFLGVKIVDEFFSEDE